MNANTNISLRQCAKTFGSVCALEALDLDIAAGETVAVLGPSGCGKTTLLRLIAGLEAPDPGGRVLFGADDVTKLPIERRNVGMVFQSYALFPNLSVEDNVAYGLRVRRATPADRKTRVGEMLRMMHIEELATRRIDQLSGGQRQRVALARAIAVRPRVLLLDEPLTALDAKLRENLRIEIDALLRKLGITSVYVTHDQAEAMSLGDRIVVMSRGKVVQVGSPREIYFKPVNAFVADFIGTVNRLSGETKNKRFYCELGSIPWPDVDRRLELLVRPQDFEICEPSFDALTGSIVSAFFLGDRNRLAVGRATDPPVLVEADGRREYRVGDKIGLRLDPQKAMAR